MLEMLGCDWERRSIGQREMRDEIGFVVVIIAMKAV
jgi:hypothetical protein